MDVGVCGKYHLHMLSACDLGQRLVRSSNHGSRGQASLSSAQKVMSQEQLLSRRVASLRYQSLSLTSTMATPYGHETHYNSMAPKGETVHADDLNRIKKELDLLKNAV